MNTTAPVAVIADVIGSRKQGDRTEVQRSAEAALDRIAEAVPPLEPFRATVGDEFQAIYASRSQALGATLFAGLIAAKGIVRFPENRAADAKSRWALSLPAPNLRKSCAPAGQR